MTTSGALDVGKHNPVDVTAGDKTMTLADATTSVTMIAAATQSLSPVVFTVCGQAPAATQKVITVFDTDSTTVL